MQGEQWIVQLLVVVWVCKAILQKVFRILKMHIALDLLQTYCLKQNYVESSMFQVFHQSKN